MNNKYKVKDIIAAIDSLLGTEEKTLKLTNEVANPKVEVLKLVNEIKDSKKNLIIYLKILKKLYCRQKNI